MFVTEETMIGLPFGWTAARLSSTIESGWLGEVSDHAYAAGLAVLALAGPPGDLRGHAHTVQVRLSGPRERRTGVTYALRWEATGPAGELFPVLDADLSLIRVDAGHARLAIIACYRPSPGTRGVQLDRLLLGRMARTTLRSLLDSFVREMSRPARTSTRMPTRSASRAGEALCAARAIVRSALKILNIHPNEPWFRTAARCWDDEVMASRVPFYFVDVFATRPLTGNPLSLVPDADGLDETQMCAIAREFNQSETTFLLRPSLPGATVRLRSFTPAGVEVGGAGHNALGAWLWLEAAGRLAPPNES